MKLSLANNNKLDQLSELYQEYGYVKLENALDNASAEEISSHIVMQKLWNLVFNHKGKHHDLNSIEVEDWELDKKNDLLDIVHQQSKQPALQPTR